MHTQRFFLVSLNIVAQTKPTPNMDLLLLMRDISQILHKVDSVTQHIKFDMRYFYVV